MKKSFVVTFSLKNPALNQDKVLSAIKESGNWAKINENCYIVTSLTGVDTTRDKIMSFLFQGDNIFVGELAISAAWAGLSGEVSTWIQNNLKN